MTYSRILGTGGYLPERVVTNADLEAFVDTSDAWIRERTGIEKRHLVVEGETCCDLAERAARLAIEAAGIAATDLDLIIVATTTPDQYFPSTATILEQRLDVHGCPAFDVQAVCAGFVYALSIADKFIRTGSARHVLVVGAEAFSRLLDWNDRGTCVLFGDGAGAVVLGASDEPGIVVTSLHADGAYKDMLQVPGGIGNGDYDNNHVTMKGNEVFRFAVTVLSKLVEDTLTANRLTMADVDWFIPHQANLRIIQAIARKIRLPMERVVVTVADHANTSAASIPLALDTAVRDGRIQRGQLLLLEAIGGGFTWGSALVRY
ncbi:beta-ketoacyl-ACP synthase III [uncultured Thiodictyon sp.]|uniref:beta-ketoacyl-ACP synthase III n=1 Tax=uncultured Thiodictyon sp. TaxID=1846217 RepID=UPI0025E29C9C|nr:beta-ketoacyl-ACP synthase III [uncultured Thiodictyon sp.]